MSHISYDSVGPFIINFYPIRSHAYIVSILSAHMLIYHYYYTLLNQLPTRSTVNFFYLEYIMEKIWDSDILILYLCNSKRLGLVSH